jgi:hypothetical protein
MLSLHFCKILSFICIFRVIINLSSFLFQLQPYFMSKLNNLSKLSMINKIFVIHLIMLSDMTWEIYGSLKFDSLLRSSLSVFILAYEQRNNRSFCTLWALNWCDCFLRTFFCLGLIIFVGFFGIIGLWLLPWSAFTTFLMSESTRWQI